MPCADSSSSMSIQLDVQERFVSFEFAKITCGREISARTGYSDYCRGKSLEDILQIPFLKAFKDLNLKGEESQFILYLEWDALRSAVAQYLGNSPEGIDTERCLVSSVKTTEGGAEINLVVLPPKDLPKILPCRIPGTSQNP